jgi:hypothetical protein
MFVTKQQQVAVASLTTEQLDQSVSATDKKSEGSITRSQMIRCIKDRLPSSDASEDTDKRVSDNQRERRPVKKFVRSHSTEDLIGIGVCFNFQSSSL